MTDWLFVICEVSNASTWSALLLGGVQARCSRQMAVQSKRHVFWLGKNRVASGCRQRGVHLKLRIQSARTARSLSD